MNIKKYRLTAMKEPSDAMLYELMRQVAYSAQQSSANAKVVLKKKMQETVIQIHKQRKVLKKGTH